MICFNDGYISLEQLFDMVIDNKVSREEFVEAIENYGSDKYLDGAVSGR